MRELPVAGPLAALCAALILTFALAGPGTSLAQTAAETRTYNIVHPPVCRNSRGETVRFVEARSGGAGLAAGMAARDASGQPVVYRSNYAFAPPELQSFIDRHECAHHQTGDVDLPHPPRNGPEHLMNESISDCIAILRLRDEEGYSRIAYERTLAALRRDMARIGFPESSIRSRARNIEHCYTAYGPPEEFIRGILDQRGLP